MRSGGRCTNRTGGATEVDEAVLGSRTIAQCCGYPPGDSPGQLSRPGMAAGMPGVTHTGIVSCTTNRDTATGSPGIETIADG